MNLDRLKKKVETIPTANFVTEVKKVIIPGIPNIVRIVGEWASVRRVWLTCDDGRPRPFNIKNDSEESPLFRLLQILFQKDKVFDPKTGRVLEAYPQMVKLGDLSSKIYLPGNDRRNWNTGYEIFVMNCIDRMDDWCKTNKHTKLLTKSESEIGIGWKAFQSFSKEVDNWGDPENYDLNFIKVGDGLKTEYSVSKANPEKFSQVVLEPLTSEEKSYGTYDISQLISISNNYILKYLGNTIQQIDSLLKTTFFDELQATIKSQNSTANVSNIQPQSSSQTFSFRKSSNFVQPSSQYPTVTNPIPTVTNPVPTVTKPIPTVTNPVPTVSATTICPVCGGPIVNNECPNCHISFV